MSSTSNTTITATSSILPPNASQLQRDIESTTGPSVLAQQTVAAIPGIKYNPPDFMLPWLIWEYGLEPLLPYLNEPRQAIQEGVQWQRVRGTPASLQMAFGWLDLNNITIEPETIGEHFYEYQVDTGRIIGNNELANIQALAKFSAPLRSRLARLYHGYDVRRVILDNSEYGALLSDYSGIHKNGVVLSFGRQHAIDTTLDTTSITSVRQANHQSHVKDTHWPALDNQILGGISTKVERFTLKTLTAKPTGSSWLGHWNERQWNDSAYWQIGSGHSN